MSGTNLLVVVGATGQQGSSIIKHVLAHPTLSKEFKIRGLTRNTSGGAAEALTKQGVEMVSADLEDVGSLKKAFQNAHTIFGITATIYDGKTEEHELRQGRAIVEAASSSGATWFIWSTLPNTGKISGNKFKHMYHFDSKAVTEEHIRSLKGIRSAFVAPASFMQNFEEGMAPRPSQNGDGTYVLAGCTVPTAVMPLIDTTGDMGKYVGAILEDPEKFEGKVMACASGCYTYQQIANIMSETLGKTVNYVQLPKDVYASFLPEPMKGPIVDMLSYFEEFGYYGPDTEEQVAKTAKEVKGLTSFEDWLRQKPFKPLQG